MTTRSTSPLPSPVGREVTLLPRHWAWLAAQPRSASAALRRLIDEARRDKDGRYRTQAAQEACYEFMRWEAGNRAGFEAAVRAMFAGDAVAFDAAVADWPEPIRCRARALAVPALEASMAEVP